MSYAAVTKLNTKPIEEQPQPDLNLLEGSFKPSDTSIAQGADEDVGSVSDKVNVVSESEAELLRAVIDSDPVENDNLKERFESAKVETRKVAGEIKKPSSSSSTTSPSKSNSNSNSSNREKVSNNVDKVEKKAETFAKKVEKRSEELKKDVEKQGKKVEKKGKEVEKAVRAEAKKYPIAATGIIGLANFALIASVGAVVYQNWNQPKWDRKTVTLTSIGLLTIFGAESYLGYYEYEQDKVENKKKTLPKA